MPRLFSSVRVVLVLERNRFVCISQKGSHVKYRKVGDDSVLTVIVPANRKEIPYGTFRSIMRQSQLRLEDFL